MNVTREVIHDLYPLYREGEASEDTRRLVEDFLSADPDFARHLAHGEETGLPEPDGGAPEPDAEMATLALAKRLVNLRSVIMGLAIFLTLLPLSVHGDGDSVEWVFLGTPRLVAPMLIAGAGLWVAYAVVNRRLRKTGV